MKASTSSSRNVILVGGKILDNFQHLKDPKVDLTAQLEALNYTVKNYSAPEMRLKSLHLGIHVDGKDCASRRYPYPNENGVLKPMDLLKHERKQTVVLSIGGGDIEKHKVSVGLARNLDGILKPEFRERYEAVIEEILSRNKLILVTIHNPYLGEDSTYHKHRKIARKVTEQWNEFIYGLGKKYKLAVIDLSKTLDSDNREHFGTDVTCLSNSSSEALARCIDYIVQNGHVGPVYSRHCGDKISAHPYD